MEIKRNPNSCHIPYTFTSTHNKTMIVYMGENGLSKIEELTEENKYHLNDVYETDNYIIETENEQIKTADEQIKTAEKKPKRKYTKRKKKEIIDFESLM